MKTKLMLGIWIVIIMTSMAIAYDASNPYTVNLKWVIPSDTSFSVALCGGETSIDFDDNVVNSTDSEIEPDCQDSGESTAMLTVTNDGNVAQNFSVNMTASLPSWATLYVDNDTTYASAHKFNTTAVEFGGIATAGTLDLYYWTDYTDAPEGTHTNTTQITSKTAA